MNDIQALSVDHLLLGVRATHVLDVLQINTIGKLCDMTVDDLRKVRGCGTVTIDEMRVALWKYGLALRGDTDSSVLARRRRIADFARSLFINNTAASDRGFGWCLKCAENIDDEAEKYVAYGEAPCALPLPPADDATD